MKKYLLITAALFSLAVATGCKPRQPAPEKEVRNIILVVGDGMGVAHITAVMLAGDSDKDTPARLQLQRATSGGMIVTWSANNRVTDSAAAGTAMATGQKTDNGRLGVDTLGKPLTSILRKASDAGLGTGLVVTTLIQHATPAAFYASTTDRDDYAGIAPFLVDSNVDVAIGGGRKYMTDRADGRDLLAELRAKGYTVVESIEELDGVESKAMALYPCDDMPFAVDGRPADYLARASEKALEILTANTANAAKTVGSIEAAGDESAAIANDSDKGFLLLIEGSRIDHACHDNRADALVGEMRDFDGAVGVAFDYADSHPGTLVLVVADHETGGLTLPAGEEDFRLPDSGVQYTWGTGGHTASMVPMFAYGTGAENFSGIVDNTEINHRMERLLGLE